jgi:hypothetical protein
MGAYGEREISHAVVFDRQDDLNARIRSEALCCRILYVEYGLMGDPHQVVRAVEFVVESRV